MMKPLRAIERSDRNDPNILSDPIDQLVRDRTPGVVGSDESLEAKPPGQFASSGRFDWPTPGSTAYLLPPISMSTLPTTKSLALFILLWTSSALLGCVATLTPPDGMSVLSTKSFDGLQSECLPRFPDHEGWYGGDAAYSVPLPINDGRVSLWLFGDSFVQRPGGPRGRSYPFVHNTIGLSNCDSDDGWNLDTFWRKDESGNPHAFFVPNPDADWVRSTIRETGAPPYYWLFDGFVAHDILFVGLLRIVDSEPRGPFNLPFRPIGVDLARIENYRDTPMNWRIQISALSNREDAFPASAFVVDGSYLHAFAFYDTGDGGTPRMLSRIPLDALEEWRADLSASLEYLAPDSGWNPGFQLDKARIVMEDDATEMSVHFDPATNTWIAVYSALPGPDGALTFPGSVIQFRTASALAGPWSEPAKLVSIPESKQDPLQNLGPNRFCYAAKAHPQFSSPDNLVISYVCNLFALNPGQTLEILKGLTERIDLYRPRAISVSKRPILESADVPSGPLR